MNIKVARKVAKFGVAMTALVAAFLWVDRHGITPRFALAQHEQSLAHNSPKVKVMHSAGTPPSVLLPEDEDRLAAMRAAGIQGDVSQVPAMMDALKKKHDTYSVTALRALAQLGAVKALPTIEAGMDDYPDYIQAQARAGRSRLLAEAEARKFATPQARAQAKVRHFFTESRLSATRINTGVAAYHQGRGQGQGWPLELSAMKEVADMVYRSSPDVVNKLPQLQRLDFSLDYGSALKMRFASVPKAERARRMIDELARKQRVGTDERLLIQLAVDEGLAASQAAAVKLQEMNRQRDQYKHTGFSCLFRVLHGVGDRKQAELVEQFLNDQDSWVAHYANITHPHIKRGMRVQYASGY